jgi:hypothetical protein
VFEEDNNPTNWHVMRQKCGEKWTSKNGEGPLYIDIPDPPQVFYNDYYNPQNAFYTTCWSCPKGQGPLANKPCW